MKGAACRILGKGDTAGTGDYITIYKKTHDDLITYRHESSIGTGATTITGSNVINCDGKTPYSQ